VTSIDEQRNLLTDIAAQLVRDWMERQLAEYTNHGKPGALTNAPDPIVEQSRVVQVLQNKYASETGELRYSGLSWMP
jgi:hypothetical protein